MNKTRAISLALATLTLTACGQRGMENSVATRQAVDPLEVYSAVSTFGGWTEDTDAFDPDEMVSARASISLL